MARYVSEAFYHSSFEKIIETNGARLRFLDLNIGFERKFSQTFILSPSVGLELGTMNMLTLNCSFLNWSTKKKGWQ